MRFLSGLSSEADLNSASIDKPTLLPKKSTQQMKNLIR